MRTHTRITVDAATPVEPPRTASERLTVRPAGRPPLDALVTRGPDAHGVLFSFVGYDTGLGGWEQARAGLVAAASGRTVITTELPGMSRHRTRLDARVRAAALAGDAGPWGELEAEYLLEAARVAGVTPDPSPAVVAFSTGCSLAVVTAPALTAAWGPVTSMLLVEPVGIVSRSLPALARDNLADVARWPDVTRRNRPHAWVVATRRGARRDHVSISLADLLAATGVLRRPGIPGLVAGAVDAGAPVHLVRGERSDLCPPAPFVKLDGLLTEGGVPGVTLTVAGAGHQMWHAAGVIEAIARAVYGPA